MIMDAEIIITGDEIKTPYLKFILFITVVNTSRNGVTKE